MSTGEMIGAGKGVIWMIWVLGAAGGRGSVCATVAVGLGYELRQAPPPAPAAPPSQTSTRSAC